jgi:CDP-diacylglycerol--serine O-phosphatidyltransferase
MASPADAFDRRNLLTYTSLLCGVAAIAGANGGRASFAGFFMAAAVIADTFDGRFARRFGNDPRRRALGIELDSLADAIAFGIAPPLCAALLLYETFDARGAALWGAAFIHAACAITRLASFNVEEAASAQEGFVGIPVPLAALIWASALLVQPSAAVTIGVILITAAAMVLPIRVPRPTGAGLVAFTCWPLAVGLGHLAFAIRHLN